MTAPSSASGDDVESQATHLNPSPTIPPGTTTAPARPTLACDAPRNMTPAELFHFEEYRMLRVEIESYAKQKRQLEVAVVTVLLAVYSWVFNVRHLLPPHLFGLWIPAVAVLFGIYRTWYFNSAIAREVKYCMRLEKRFLGPHGGWEAYWKRSPVEQIIKISEVMLWCVLAVVAVGVPVVASLLRCR